MVRLLSGVCRLAVSRHSMAVVALAVLALGLAGSLGALEKRDYRITIVTDTEQEFSKKIVASFRAAVDAALKAAGAKAVYSERFTALDEAKAEAIRAEIAAKSPDLCFMVNSPTTIADTYITKKLTSPKFRFVSENTIPIQTGTIKSMARPGGNVTGVGVLIQMRSAIRLMKMINPGVKRLAFASWDRVSQLNQWFEQDIREACKQEGIELAEFRRCPYAEDEYAFLARWDTPDPTVFAMEGVSAWVNKDGSDLRVDDWKKAVQGLEHLAVVTYDELPVSYGLLAGTTVVWEDIGLQLAEKALLVLNGQNPGDIPWDYPRKFNIMVNAKAAKDKGITLPQEVINAAYRVYTDYNGTFIQGTK